MKKISLIILLVFFTFTFSFSQGVGNYGAKIYVSEGAFIYGGDFTNATATQEPEIELNGTIELEGDWTNNSSGTVFSNIEDVPNGTLILSSHTESNIIGTNYTEFENLKIKNATKKIYVTDCNVFGKLQIDGILDLNTNKLIISNNSPESLEYLSGYILSESLPEDNLSELEWVISDNTGTYNIPFGSAEAENDLNIILTVNTAGDSDGSIIFATYNTDNENNPLPDDVNSLTGIEANQTVDRFWQISPNYTEKPEIDLVLTFTNTDIENNSEITTGDYQLVRYNSDENNWLDVELESSQISQENFFKWWTIIDKPEIAYIIPNGITPDGDGYNDTWILEGIQQSFEVYIYNRWGSKVYYSDSYNNDWDGDNRPSGAYFYVIKLEDGTVLTGDLNILR